jgi:hypothetical protein
MGVYVALLPSGSTTVYEEDAACSLGLLFTTMSVPALCSPSIFGSLIRIEGGREAYRSPSFFGGQFDFERS